MLPNRVPEARILTFGYASGLMFSDSMSEISDFASDLLERLRSVRRKDKMPVIPAISSSPADPETNHIPFM